MRKMRKTCQKGSVGRRTEEKRGRGTTMLEAKKQREAEAGLSGFADELPRAQQCLELGGCHQLNLAPRGDVRGEGAPWETARAVGQKELLVIARVVSRARLCREKGNSECEWVWRLSECREGHGISLLIIIN